MELYGKRPECINISLLQDRMANLGVKPAEVLATLNGQNKTTYTGYYENGDNRIRVTVNDKFKIGRRHREYAYPGARRRPATLAAILPG